MRMKRITILAKILLASVLFPLLAGCSGGTPEDTAAHGTITIDYVPTFRGENASGFSRLDLAVTITNSGGNAFSLDPSDFTVMVNDYSYAPTSTDLDRAAIAAGQSVTGTLCYEVPPTAKISSTGFAVVYHGGPEAGVSLVRSTTTTAAPKPDPYVSIRYNLDWFWLAAPGTEYLRVDPPGKLYLAVEMFVDNHGYESFNTNADYFSVTASSLEETFDSPVEEEIIDWRDLDIQDGGSFIGTLMFTMPIDAARTSNTWQYYPHYNGLRHYDIRWQEQVRTECYPDVPLSGFPRITMKDGDTFEGSVYYPLDETIKTDGMSLRMLYQDMDWDNYLQYLYNVQWVDQPGLEVDINRDPVAPPVIKITYSTRLTTFPDSARTWVVVHMFIEDRGYDDYDLDPSVFYLEVLSAP